jgi:hypothetical protein
MIIPILIGIQSNSFGQLQKQNSIIKEGPLKKAGSKLADLFAEFQTQNTVNSVTTFTSNNSLLHTENNNVLVDIIAFGDPSDLEQDLIDLGMSVYGIAGPIISGFLPINAIPTVSLLENVNFFRPAMWTTNIGATTSQGDAAMYSDAVKTSLGIDGSGVIVGVLSDSYNALATAAADVTSGDLPGATNPNGYTTPINVLDDLTTGTDEGRAMLQIIHDVAPGAELAFATAFTGQAGFANNIAALRTTGNANVIVDDVFYYAEPMFQDGIIAQAADAAYAAGASYFSSAGNSGQKSYESVWRSGPPEFGYPSTFDFDPGPGVDNLQSFTLGAGQTITITLQWDSPFASVCTSCPGSQNDLDIALFNSAGVVLASSLSNNIDGDAVEIIQYKNFTGATETLNIMILKSSGNDPGFIKYINFGSEQGSLEFATNSSTIYGHSNAAGAIAVGAAAYFNTPAFGVTPPLLNGFSSWGPTAIRFATDGSPTIDPRAGKPEITAPDGVNTTFFGNDITNDADTYPNFFGTSAAAPHAAAIAALMLEVNGSLTPAQIYTNMKAGTVDMGTPGFDNGSGYGLINATDISPLPVELSSFNVSAGVDNIYLTWTTATEVNNYGFEIERKMEKIDGSESSSTSEITRWDKIGFVEGHGNSNSPKYYSFDDNTLESSGKYSYRLKQIDIDGTFEYSDVIEANLSAPNTFTLDQNYPNPFNPITSISYSLPTDGHVTLTIYDVLGKEVALLANGFKTAGSYTSSFDATKLSSGMYFYTIKTGQFVDTKKMLLMK